MITTFSPKLEYTIDEQVEREWVSESEQPIENTWEKTTVDRGEREKQWWILGSREREEE